MKLRVKIIIMCIISVVISMTVIGCTIMKLYIKNTISIVATLNQNEFGEIYDDYVIAYKGADYNGNEETFATDYFKSKKDDLTIYVNGRNNNSIFNHTVFSSEELQAFFDDDSVSIEKDIEYSEVDWNGKKILIFKKHFKENMLYHIFDISHIRENIFSLVSKMILIFVLVITIMVVFLVFMLKKEFKPMQEIVEVSADMVAGNYDRRIDVKKSDEIGIMAQSFNEMSEAVQKRIEELEDEHIKKTIFMGNLAHEMKTPLSAIYGYAQTLQAIKLNREDEERAYRYIEEESIRLSHLFEKLMKLILMNEEEIIKKEKVKVQELFEKAIRACHKKIQTKNIKIHFDETTQIVTVDKELFLDVIINLLDNALNASINGGKVNLYIRQDEYMQIIIEDFGVGIAREEKERIVEPFYMIDKSRSRKSGSAGLGLALVDTILKRHNMFLAIDSEEGKGTKMIINIAQEN